MTLSVFAPAKINLSLQVGPPRADGLHPLRSIAAFASVGDRLGFARDTGLSLTVTGPFAAALAEETDNLALRAARLLAGDKPLGAAITLEKNLPIASGIGGGSADAAATLRGLNAFWGLGHSEAELARLAEGLGADVPVCVGCRAALMTGTGAELTPLDLPPLAAVLVNPLVPAPTGAVYRRFDALGLGRPLTAEPAPVWASSGEAISALVGLDNDLTPAALETAPAIGDVLARLRADPRVRLVRLSGSGATCFALTDGAALAHALAQDLTAEQRGWWVQAAQLGSVDAGAVSL